MTVGLFIPCYIDQFYPRVGIATLRLLERLGCTVGFPLDQTCCGQPMANAGFEGDSLGALRLFVDNFAGYDYIVAPSGSCVLHVREHYGRLDPSEAVRQVQARTYELCQFITEVLGVEQIPARFPYRVGLHPSCHGLRGLRLGSASEVLEHRPDRVRGLLQHVEGIELIDLDRRDECCGFGGTFAVTEEAISVRMGRDRLQDHLTNGAEVITGTDMSCLMHLEGLARRERLPVRVMHVAEILQGGDA